MSKKEVKPRSEESLLRTHAFIVKLDKIFSDLQACRKATRAPQRSPRAAMVCEIGRGKAASQLKMTAQQAV
jgi:hypothetical protein